MTEEQTKRYLAAIESIAATLKLIERPVLDACMIAMHPPRSVGMIDDELRRAGLCLCPTCTKHRASKWDPNGARAGL